MSALSSRKKVGAGDGDEMGLLNDILFLGVLALVPLGLLGALYLKWIWPYLAVRKSPAADITLIRARLGGEGHRVIDVARTGREITDEWVAGRPSLTRVFRIYRVTIQYPDHTETGIDVGVACTLISSPYLVTYEHGKRKALWTRYQASLP